MLVLSSGSTLTRYTVRYPCGPISANCPIDMRPERSFLFVGLADLMKGPSQDTLLLEVPANLIDKTALLAWYGHNLRIPNYFGRNWDALDECLIDRKWISENKIILFHSRLPLAADRHDKRIYLQVLANTAHDETSSHKVIVAFDRGLEQEVASALPY